MIKFFRNLLSNESKVERRSTGTTLNNSFAWLFGSKTSSGVNVNRTNVMGDSAFWRSVVILSNAIASLPWQVFREENGQVLRAKDHPVDFILHKSPHPLYSSFTFRQALIVQMLTKANGAYARIIRDPQSGEPIQLQLLQSENVELFESSIGDIFYMVKAVGVTGKIKSSFEVRPENMIHIKYLSSDAVNGIDIIGTHKENLGINIAATQYAANFFGNGAHVSSVLEAEGNITPEAANRLRLQWDQKFGGVNNTGKTAVLEDGLKYKKVGLDPNEANLNDTKKFQIEEVGRIIGIPAHMLSAMDSATFNNIEVMSIEFVKNTLRPLLVMIEQEFNRKLFTRDEYKEGNVYSRFNMDGLLRGSTKDRFDAYAISIQNKFMSPNEVRSLENLNPREGGDKFENPMIQVEENEPNETPTE